MKNYVQRPLFRKYLFLALAICWAATAAFGQIYAATRLLPPSGYSFANLDGSMNNYGQVLGEVTGPDRVPVLWTIGVPQILPIPSGYSYIAALYSYKVNNSGTVIGTVQEAHTLNRHVLIWKNGIATRLQENMSQICPNIGGLSDVPDTYSTGLNSAGHIVGTTTYPGAPGCRSSWFWDGAKFTPLPNPVPPQCKAGTTNAEMFPTLNDADLVVDTVDNLFCTNWKNDKGETIGNGPAIMFPPSFQTYLFVPLGASTGFTAQSINNLSMIAGCITCGSPFEVGVWDSANGLRRFGAKTGYGSLNNIGQVVYMQDPGQPDAQLRIWFKGTSAPVQLPSPVTESYLPAALNDSGQIALQRNGVDAYVITPALRCPTCR